MVKNRTVQRKITRKLIKIETPGSRHLKEKNRGVTTFWGVTPKCPPQLPHTLGRPLNKFDYSKPLQILY